MNVHARLCCLAHADIEVSSHDPLWNYTDMLSFVDLFLKTISVLFASDQATSIISVGSKGHTTFMCGLFSFNLGSDYSYKFPLCPLCKGEALELFSVGKQLVSSPLVTCSQMLRLKNKATQKMLNVKALRPSEHYFPQDITTSGRRLQRICLRKLNI